MIGLSEFFYDWRCRQRLLEQDQKMTHLQQVKQSFRPHNTPVWFNLGLYLREWFFLFSTVNECVYGDAAMLHNDIEARFPRSNYDFAEFLAMLEDHYGYTWEKGVTFTRADIMAEYTHAKSFEELEQAKALKV
jgi:hypothetical protein